MTSKTRFLYFLIIALVLINVGTLVVMFMHGPPRGEKGPREVSRWLSGQLNFTAAQQEQYQTLQEEHRKNMEPIHRQDRNFHDRYFQLLKGEVSDSVLVRSLADSIAFNRVQTELTTFYD